MAATTVVLSEDIQRILEMTKGKTVDKKLACIQQHMKVNFDITRVLNDPETLEQKLREQNWREADRMEKLVADMLELIRLESGAVRLKPCAFSVYRLAADSVEKMAHLAKDKGMDIEIEGQFDIQASADKGKIEQVLLNLLGNAIRHGAEGSAVRIRLDMQEPLIRVSVANEGASIPEEQLPLIWDRFYRGEESRSRKAGGTGIGLSIVKGIMQLHQGSSDVCNIPNGVLFILHLKVQVLAVVLEEAFM